MKFVFLIDKDGTLPGFAMYLGSKPKGRVKVEADDHFGAGWLFLSRLIQHGGYRLTSTWPDSWRAEFVGYMVGEWIEDWVWARRKRLGQWTSDD